MPATTVTIDALFDATCFQPTMADLVSLAGQGCPLGHEYGQIKI
jgi:hypothetical protein